jgi:hypothetical protein
MRIVQNVSIQELAKELGKTMDKNRINEFKTAVSVGCYRSLPYMAKVSPVDTGLYAQSWAIDSDETSVILGNTAPHSPMIEFGTRPFKPPIGPLLAWAKRVLQDPSQPPNYSNDVWQLAVGVQRKIEREGMKPRSVLKNALPQIIENIKAEMMKL